jgi:4-hydroxy-2-oxoheptanedioate aldolase
MLHNPLKERLAQGRPILGVMATLPSIPSVQVLSRVGFDYVKLDLEHSPIDRPLLHGMIAATTGTGTTPIVRIPHCAAWLVTPVLDSGALGITFPLVRNRAEAELAARATKYGPEGDRSWGPFYAAHRWNISMGDYVEQANPALYTEVLIEHVDAIRNLEEILSVPGIDSAFIAPGDLAVSMGFKSDKEHPKVREAIAYAERTIRGSKVHLGGLATDGERARGMLDRGYRVLTLGFDFLHLQQSCTALLNEVKA